VDTTGPGFKQGDGKCPNTRAGRAGNRAIGGRPDRPHRTGSSCSFFLQRSRFSRECRRGVTPLDRWRVLATRARASAQAMTVPPRRWPDCSVVLEVLHRPLVLFGGRSTSERSEVSSFARAGVGFAGIQPVFSRAEFADHGGFPFFRCWQKKAANAGAGVCPFDVPHRHRQACNSRAKSRRSGPQARAVCRSRSRIPLHRLVSKHKLTA